jgi:hypothetical protein
MSEVTRWWEERGSAAGIGLGLGYCIVKQY